MTHQSYYPLSSTQTGSGRGGSCNCADDLRQPSPHKAVPSVTVSNTADANGPYVYHKVDPSPEPITGHGADLAENATLRAEVAKLTSQLPAEMQHCTIQFKECEVGHGRLTATNWIDRGCPYCQIAKLQGELEAARLDRELIINNLEFKCSEVDQYLEIVRQRDVELSSVKAERDVQAAALAKINDIRNSIVGFQNVGFSEHVYPLVAALEEAGIEGEGYEKSSAEITEMLLAKERLQAKADLCDRMGEQAGFAVKVVHCSHDGALEHCEWPICEHIVKLLAELARL